MQANARLHRQGQAKPVMIFRLVAKQTHDIRVVGALKRKNTGQEALMEATKALINKYTKCWVRSTKIKLDDQNMNVVKS